MHIYVAIYMYIFGTTCMQVNKILDSRRKYLPLCYFYVALIWNSFDMSFLSKQCTNKIYSFII